LRRWLEVLAAVELDGQVPAGAIKVEDVRAARMLPTELETRESFGTKVKPEGSFGVRAVAAQSATTSERDVHALSSA